MSLAVKRNWISRLFASWLTSCNEWLISVTDSGKGIAADQLEAIFTPYFTTKAEGTGLGLAVVHNIV